MNGSIRICNIFKLMTNSRSRKIFIYNITLSSNEVRNFFKSFRFVCFGSKVLFQYNDSRLPLEVKSCDNIVQRVKNYYKISKELDIVFQKYSETWEEWVDIKEDEILDRDKIQIIVLENPCLKKTQESLVNIDYISI